MTDPAQAAAVTAAALAAKEPALITPAGYAMLVFGGLIVLTLIVIFWRAQNSGTSKIDFADMLLDPLTKKLTPARFWNLIGGAAATFVFVYLPVSGHFDPTYASAYIIAVLAAKAVADITSKPPEPDGKPAKPKPKGR
jgi:hypothetical protein